jgi:hypothetical protein
MSIHWLVVGYSWQSCKICTLGKRRVGLHWIGTRTLSILYVGHAKLHQRVAVSASCAPCILHRWW